MKARLDTRGGTDQWVRMRQDKLRSLKKALLYSYQKAIVQKYNVQNETLILNIETIIHLMEVQEDYTEYLEILQQLESEYDFLDSQERGSAHYIEGLNNIIASLSAEEPLFRCLINHDKLKVDYEDKIISIPFQQVPINGTEEIWTNFHNGTVFRWVHGNKQEWTPDTYWIVYMQYSEQTAYFRAEIRKADEEIQIVTIDDEGNEKTSTYRGWMTGPNETTALWNVKKNVTWNDMNYTKLLYITKDENTQAFFKRFDRIIINNTPWEVQAYNQTYSVNASTGTGIIRVALKETYTNTNQFVRQEIENINQAIEAQTQYDETHTEARIAGLLQVWPLAIVSYEAKNFTDNLQWSISNPSLAKIINTSEDGKKIKVKILAETSNSTGFYINYGDSDDTKIHVSIKSF